MKLISILLLLFASVSIADVVWTYDFEELPEGWFTDKWEFDSPGASVFVSAIGGPYTVDTGTMTSDTYTMPYGTTSVSFSVTDIWFLDGYVTTGESMSSITITVYETTVQYIIEFDSENWGTMVDSGGSRSVYVTLPLKEGDEFHVCFKAYSEAEYGYAEADWYVTEFQITAWGAQELEAFTWAGVKQSF